MLDSFPMRSENESGGESIERLARTIPDSTKQKPKRNLMFPVLERNAPAGEFSSRSQALLGNAGGGDGG